MNTKKTRALLGLLLTALMLLLSACGQADGGSEAEEALWTRIIIGLP